MSVLWTILGRRNKYNHEEVQYQPHMSMELVDELLNDQIYGQRWTCYSNWRMLNGVDVKLSGFAISTQKTCLSFFHVKYSPSLNTCACTSNFSIKFQLYFHQILTFYCPNGRARQRAPTWSSIHSISLCSHAHDTTMC